MREKLKAELLNRRRSRLVITRIFLTAEIIVGIVIAVADTVVAYQ